MGTHEGITYAAFKRLDGLMAIGESRREVKRAFREQCDEPLWSLSTGRMHSFKTRQKYQGVVMHFLDWCKTQRQVYRLDALEAQAEELVTAYVSERLAQGYTPATLQADRSGLRLFFGNWDLAAGVAIPPRRRQDIRYSRQPAARDRRKNPAIAEPLERFFAACGIRRDEACRIRVEDIQPSQRPRYHLEVVIAEGYGKGGRPRRAPVYPGREQDVLLLLEGRVPGERVFPRGVYSLLNPQAQRRQYAQDWYRRLSRRDLPPTNRRLRPGDYDQAAALEVSQYLGHSRLDVILRSYLR
ncbi:MAG: site-specific integrase [Ktedonobacteraceae bacterium]|nr:site-specific integrase [Ktedonobacteraceae bacterium]